ncbi:MAG TPA: ribonuclease H-like domain-containing protein, partial [Candidatus Paceibacterota bacterium]
MPAPRVLVWDIECTNLNASFGTLLAIAYKWVGEQKVYVPTILDYKMRGNMLDDKPLVADFKKIYMTADYTVAHYGKRFDRPFLQTKCLKHRLGPLPDLPMMDTCEVAWKNFKLHSNRLAAWLEYLGCKHEKMPMRADDWLHAAHGCSKAMKAVKARAREDVLGLEEVFLAMRPWMKDEPVRGMFTGEMG